MALSISALARPSLLVSTLLGVLAASGLLILTPKLTLAEADSHGVPAAETAVQQLLPEGGEVLGSRLLTPDSAEVMVKARDQVSPVIMKLTASGQWQQDMKATLARGAADMQSLAQSNQSTLPAFGQSGGDLLQTTQAAAGLLPPANKERETQRALSGAGRSDPFAPLNVIPPTPEPITNLPPLPTGLPPIPGVAPVPGTGPTPTPDPAQFAKNVQVSGIIQIDRESYALVSANGTLPSVVQSGQKYESADVTSISSRKKEVVLREAGQTVVHPIDASSVVQSAPVAKP